MAQIVEEALDGILGNMFLTSPPLCTLEELEALMCVSCLLSLPGHWGQSGFTPGILSTFWPAVKFLKRAGGLLNLGVH